MTAQIKSKQRVAERGEVFTAEREVNAMLDLVKQETERAGRRRWKFPCGDSSPKIGGGKETGNSAKKEKPPAIGI